MTGLDRYALAMHVKRRQAELAQAALLTTWLALPSAPGVPQQVVRKRARCMLTLTDYRNDSTGWDDAGVITAAGVVARLTDASAAVFAAFWRAEPIRGALVVCLPLEDTQ